VPRSKDLGPALETGVCQKQAPLGDIDIETCSECGGDVRINAAYTRDEIVHIRLIQGAGLLIR